MSPTFRLTPLLDLPTQQLKLDAIRGEYVGLTGARLDGAGMLACGLATHFVSLESMGGAVALKVHLKEKSEWDGVVLVAAMCKVKFPFYP
ncbi:hypothetical protein L2E82_19017 [Cichorium intybus]|uniref:Uncharacterized protein n=1 Tax=Cichorium intybus TaxID=13427 RepID=A0ACB9FBU9_CICIN|nr:hypothetical protein L2E82_19017 [Cichorium intybus]